MFQFLLIIKIGKANVTTKYKYQSEPELLPPLLLLTLLPNWSEPPFLFSLLLLLLLSLLLLLFLSLLLLLFLSLLRLLLLSLLLLLLCFRSLLRLLSLLSLLLLLLLPFSSLLSRSLLSGSLFFSFLSLSMTSFKSSPLPSVFTGLELSLKLCFCPATYSSLPFPFHRNLDTLWLKSTWILRSSMSTLSILK